MPDHIPDRDLRCKYGGVPSGVEIVRADTALSQARRLVMQYGHNATAYQILNPGIRHWFSARDDAVVGYVSRGSWLLVAGEPVCAQTILHETIREFEAFAHERNCHICYVCAADSMRTAVADLRGHSTVTIGAQPVWSPADWQNTVRTRRSVRTQLNRARNKRVEIESVAPAHAVENPEIRQTLEEWLHVRRLPPMHFLVEPDVLSGVVDDRILLLAKVQNRVVAFLVASPVAARNGFLIEELARSPRAPNGTSELLIHAAMKRFAESGATWVTMGLVALAQGTISGNPFWLRSLMALARAHANRFYNFRGLERFRSKMQPNKWEKLYAISNQPSFSPQALYAMGGAFSGISPVRAIGIAILKAAREELRMLERKFSR